MKCLVVYGTRPEAIKLYPVIRQLLARRDVEVVVCSTGQHGALIDNVELLFGLYPHIRLHSTSNGDLNHLSSALLARLGQVVSLGDYDVVVVQGDTTSAAMAALAAFHNHTPVAHVEAGLRTHDISSPFPEEMNRRLIDSIATWHFAPTDTARRNLLDEGVGDASIVVTGNTSIDALMLCERLLPTASTAGQFIFCTIHRREADLPAIFSVLRLLAATHEIRLPLHPRAQHAADAHGLEVSPPLSYLDSIASIRDASLIITDSGGIQEEAAYFGTPTLVVRNSTERVEGVTVGVAQLTTVGELADAVDRLMAVHAPKSPQPLLYGDGRAAERIVTALVETPLPRRRQCQ